MDDVLKLCTFQTPIVYPEIAKGDFLDIKGVLSVAKATFGGRPVACEAGLVTVT
jgi:hypothetical protein